ncbi:MAG: CoA transferase [Actinomycetia bacterium]|nr:CoA transferase [Actinomycetes bacterium]
MGGVLDGIRIADFTAVMAGSSGAMFLGDLGADVVKVENTEGGDYARQAQPYLFQSVNRNKRSLALDLATPEGLAVAKQLVATSDIVLQGYRPGALEAKGLGADALRADNPQLIYLSLCGYGTTGPGAQKRGIDQLVQADTGMAHAMGEVNQRLGLVDAAAGIAVAQAVLAALFRREREGVGATVEVSLYDTSLWLQMLPIGEFSVTRVPAEPPETYVLRIPTMGTFDVADGRIFIAVLNQATWERLCELMGESGLVEDERFASRELRSKHGAVVKELFGKALQRFDVATILGWGEREGFMTTEVKEYGDVLLDPQAEANESFQTIELFDGRQHTQVRGPWRFLGEPTHPYRRPPTLGEDSRSVLADLGYAADAVAGLVERGVVRG